MSNSPKYISREEAINIFKEQLSFILNYIKKYEGDLDLYLLACWTYEDIEGPHGFMEVIEPKVLEWLERIETRLEELSSSQIESILSHYLLPDAFISIEK